MNDAFAGIRRRGYRTLLGDQRRCFVGSMRPVSRSNRRVRPGQTHRHQPLRAPLRYNRQVYDQEFVQRVRRHLPASLVPIVARYGSAFSKREQYLKPRSTQSAPWVLAEVARASLVYGTDFNRKPATDNDLLSCCAAYQSLAEQRSRSSTWPPETSCGQDNRKPRAAPAFQTAITDGLVSTRCPAVPSLRGTRTL